MEYRQIGKTGIKASIIGLGSECTSCGNCERLCPFGIPVINNMKKAAALFGL
jgi:predicted aldo/keto reductase-like oxidoreductase